MLSAHIKQDGLKNLRFVEIKIDNMYREEHAFRKIQKDMKSGSLPRILLLCGREQFLVEWARNRIVDLNIEKASRVLDLTIIDEQDPSSWINNIQNSSQSGNKMHTVDIVIENCETLPLFSPKKIVIWKEPKLLSSGDKQDGKNSDVSRLCDYMDKIPETTILIITAQSIDNKKKIAKSITKNGAIYNFDQLERSDLINFADKRFRAGNVPVPGRVMNYLIEKTGYYNKESDYNLFIFSNDIQKMIAMADGGELTEEIVKDTVESDLETFVFSLMNSISEGRKDRAFTLLHNIVSDSSDVLRLVALIVGQFEVMYSVKELYENRVPDRIIAEKTGVSEARIRALRPFVTKNSLAKLKANLEYAYEIDRNIKTGLLPYSLALEMFVAKL